MIPRHRRRQPLHEYVLRGLIRAEFAMIVIVCGLAQYASANGRFLP